MDERIMTGFDDIVCVHTVHDGHIYIYVGYMVLGRETPTTWLPGYIYTEPQYHNIEHVL